MKIRNGFVSNSSSSSFLVKFKDVWNNFDNPKPLITKRQYNALIKRNYKFTWLTTASDLQAIGGRHDLIVKKIPKKDEVFVESLGKYIICNQESEIDWLVKHKIPFQASTQYGTQTVIYDSKRLMTIENPGCHCDMYGINDAYLRELMQDGLASIDYLEDEYED